MSYLTRWEPFRESRRMHDMLDRFMGRAFLDAPWFEGIGTGGLPLDVYQTDEAWVVKASVPGMKPEEIDISVSGDTLTIQGESKQELESKDENVQYHIRERRISRFSRSLTLPGGVNADQAKAESENGILTMSLPKTEQVKPKRITVKVK